MLLNIRFVLLDTLKLVYRSWIFLDVITFMERESITEFSQVKIDGWAIMIILYKLQIIISAKQN